VLIKALLVLLISVASATAADFPPPIESYGDAEMPVWAKLTHRLQVEPFNLAATLIFLGAIGHTFLVARFRHVAHACEHRLADGGLSPQQSDRLRFRATLFHFLGEVEAVFGIWLIPLFAAIAVFKGFNSAVHYLDGVNYSEAIFVTVIMAMAATRPVLVFAESFLEKVARLLGGKVVSWWLAILTVGPLLGSFITEPAAMTLCALLLGQRFYAQQPSMRLRYATLGLLFVNISVGGTLTHFAAPPVVMVAGKWGYGLSHMMLNFGWKAVVGIVISNAIYWLAFRRELEALAPAAAEEPRRRIPVFVTITHLLFLAWTVLNAHHAALVVLGLLFFLAYVAATEAHQEEVAIRGPLLVGFFLAALVAHGGCQQWWIGPVLGSLSPWPLMIGSIVLTAFNDNAAITYLASLVPTLTDEMKFAVLAGAVSGGGLTVIANAPNPAGQSILQRYFGEDGISPLGLALAAVIPTIVVGAAMMLL
jgi:Putative Na+/H+ antiporter